LSDPIILDAFFVPSGEIAALFTTVTASFYISSASISTLYG